MGITKDQIRKKLDKDQRVKTYEEIGSEIGRLVDEKNKAYGNSFGQSCKILEILYPDGVKVEQYTDMLCLVRIIDKLFRIATQKSAFNESPYRDICGYGVLGVKKDEE